MKEEVKVTEIERIIEAAKDVLEWMQSPIHGGRMETTISESFNGDDYGIELEEAINAYEDANGG